MFDFPEDEFDDYKPRYSRNEMNAALKAQSQTWFLIGAVAGLVVMAIAVWNS